MNGFVIKKADGTAAFELETAKIWDLDDIDATITVKYNLHDKTLLYHNLWSFGVVFLSNLLDDMKFMHETMKGDAKFSSFNNDELLLTIKSGIVKVEVTDNTCYNSSNAMVQLEFQIDQSYLPEIISQLTDCIQSIREACPVKQN